MVSAAGASLMRSSRGGGFVEARRPSVDLGVGMPIQPVCEQMLPLHEESSLCARRLSRGGIAGIRIPSRCASSVVKRSS